MPANRKTIRPGQMYDECEECGAFARGGSKQPVLTHLPGCSKAPPTPAAAPEDDDGEGAR